MTGRAGAAKAVLPMAETPGGGEGGREEEGRQPGSKGTRGRMDSTCTTTTTAPSPSGSLALRTEKSEQIWVWDLPLLVAVWLWASQITSLSFKCLI